MDSQEKTEDGKACCSKGKCCGGKSLAALALLLIGGAGGYFCARHCAAKSDAPTAASVQAQTK
jgi:hypothetical protein